MWEPENESENYENDINDKDWHTASGAFVNYTSNEFLDAGENLITAKLCQITGIAATVHP